MKIDITKDEYHRLLDLLYMANWVLHSHKTEEEPRTKPYDETIQKIYSLASTMGFGRLIEFDAHDRRFYATREFEASTGATEFLEEYDDDTFWDELVYRLAERDAAHGVGGYEQLNLLEPEDRSSLETAARERYSEEFNENGIDRIVIAEEFDPKASKTGKTSD